MRNKKATGELGEHLAAEHYRRLGYVVLARNYTIRQGEVDLILKKDAILVFCEVKARRTGAMAAPIEAVDTHKQRRVRMAAQHWLASRGLSEPLMRFDVAEVFLAGDGRPRVVLHENAF